MTSQATLWRVRQPLLAGPRDFDLRSALARTHRIEYKVRARARSDLSTHRIDEQRFECPVRSARRKRLATTPGTSSRREAAPRRAGERLAGGRLRPESDARGRGTDTPPL